MIEYRDIGMAYGDNVILEKINLTITDGELFVLVGPSGSGKTTLLRMINRLTEPSQGDLYLDGKRVKDHDLRQLRLHMGYVLQTGGLFPFLTVEENIALTAHASGTDNAAARAWAAELMDRLEITRLRRAWPDTLSIGERQRVAIARALAPRPRLLLADEPTAALDPGLSRKVMKLFLDVVRECSASVVMVSHDVSLVHEFAFREVPIVVRSEGDHLSAVLDERGGEA